MKNKTQKYFTSLLCAFALCTSLHSNAQSVQIYRGGTAIGAPYSTLVAAIAAAANGDSLKLSADTFYEHDVLIKKGLIIAGTYTAPDSTIIDAQKKGRVLYARHGLGNTLVLRDVIISHGYTTESGGGIFQDTMGRLKLCGATIVRNNTALGGGGGIAYDPHGWDNIITIGDNVQIANNTANTNGGLGTGGLTKCILSGNAWIRDNVATAIPLYSQREIAALGEIAGTGGIGVDTLEIVGGGSEGGVRITHNKALGSIGGLYCQELLLHGTVDVSYNSADYNTGGFYIEEFYIEGDGVLNAHHNTAYFGGGCLLKITASYGSPTFNIYNNHAIWGGGGIGTKACGPGRFSDKDLTLNVYDNTADSIGGAFLLFPNYALAASTDVSKLSNANIYNNKAKVGNGIACFIDARDILRKIVLGVNNCRLYNPSATGNYKEITAPNNTLVEVYSTWLGKSDTTGLIERSGTGDVKLNTWVQCDWELNKGLPVGKLPFPLTAKFRLNTAAPLASGSFKMLEGRYSASIGSFTPALAAMQITNEIESMYRGTSTGMAHIMGIVDADTFQKDLMVSAIKELGFEQVKIYPNPTKDELNISNLPVGITLHIYDAAGRVMLQQAYLDALPNLVLQVAQLPAGVYTIKLYNLLDQMGTVQFVKK